jgi:DNA polymerase III delta prime subunit
MQISNKRKKKEKERGDIFYFQRKQTKENKREKKILRIYFIPQLQKIKSITGIKIETNTFSCIITKPPYKMESITPEEFNQILGRTEIANQIADFLCRFQEIRQDIDQKKGVYLYGASGIGKTQFILSIVRKMGYDPILYDAGDVRNKSFMDSIASQYLSTNNVLQLFRKQPKQIAIIMDEIDGMNRNDQGGLSALSKLIRHKKMKKHKKENTSAHPILCISNYYTDKKIRDLMKVCHTFELKEPTDEQMEKLLRRFCPPNYQSLLTPEYQNTIIQYAKNDIRKLAQLCSYLFSPHITSSSQPPSLQILENKLYNDDVKEITQQLLTKAYRFNEHSHIMNDTDRTIISLLYHENIVDSMNTITPQISFPFYLKLLDNLCFSDYMYRITFQSQIWQFNEMCYLLKIMYNNYLFHQWSSSLTPVSINTSIAPSSPCFNQITKKDIRFTKILTKYSTEYGNMIFLYFLCEEMGMEKKDVIAFFQELRLFFKQPPGATKTSGGTKGIEFDTPQVISEMEKIFQPNHNINRLEIRRMYRFLNQLSITDEKDAEAVNLRKFQEDSDHEEDWGENEEEEDDSDD